VNKNFLLVSLLCCLSCTCLGLGKAKPVFYDRSLASAETPTVSLVSHEPILISVLLSSDAQQSEVAHFNTYWHPRPSARKMHRAGVALTILGSVATLVGAAFFIAGSQKHNYTDEYGVYHHAYPEGDWLLGGLAGAGGLTSLTFGVILLSRSRRQ
jgi:hypothetical protein